MWGSEEMLSDSMEIPSEHPEVHYKQQCNQYIHLCKLPCMLQIIWMEVFYENVGKTTD